MKHIEIIGPPGAGKSTLQRPLINDTNILGNNERYQCVQQVSSLFKVINRLMFSNQIKQKIGALYWKHVLYEKCLMQFREEFPAVFEIFDKASRLDERSNYPQMYYHAGAEFICFRNNVDSTFIIDEGLPQLASEVLFVDQELGRQFLQLIPVPDAIIRVSCPPDECLRRQFTREKPLASSLSDKDHKEAIDRLKLYRTQYETTAECLTQRGSEIVRVDTGDKNIDECLKKICSKMNIEH